MQKSIFNDIGLEVLASAGGVYHFQTLGAYSAFKPKGLHGVAIGLLFAEKTGASLTKVRLFLQEIEDPYLGERVMRHWQLLDARRLEESGLPYLDLDVPPQLRPVSDTISNCFRLDGPSIRQFAQLQSGDVVCYT